MSFKIPCGGFKLDEKLFSLDKNDVLSIPKPLTYDYMPEGYPKKGIETVTLMEEQEVAFAFDSKEGVYAAQLTEAPAIAKGQTYVVNWDGTEYECVCYVFNSFPVLGNISIMGVGDDTGEPFIYIFETRQRTFATLDASANHTIKVMRQQVTITPMSTDFVPKNLNVVFKKESGSTQVNCNVTYNELRDWVERDVPVFAVFIDATSSTYHRYNIVGIALLTDMLGFAYYVGNSIDKTFTYKSDGTIEI